MSNAGISVNGANYTITDRYGIKCNALTKTNLLVNSSFENLVKVSIGSAWNEEAVLSIANWNIITEVNCFSGFGYGYTTSGNISLKVQGGCGVSQVVLLKPQTNYTLSWICNAFLSVGGGNGYEDDPIPPSVVVKIEMLDVNDAIRWEQSTAYTNAAYKARNSCIINIDPSIFSYSTVPRVRISILGGSDNIALDSCQLVEDDLPSLYLYTPTEPMSFFEYGASGLSSHMSADIDWLIHYRVDDSATMAEGGCC